MLLVVVDNTLPLFSDVDFFADVVVVLGALILLMLFLVDDDVIVLPVVGVEAVDCCC